MGYPSNELLGSYLVQTELNVIYTTKLTIPKCVGRGPEHSLLVHKPPRLELSLTRRRGFPALAVETMFFP